MKVLYLHYMNVTAPRICLGHSGTQVSQAPTHAAPAQIDLHPPWQLDTESFFNVYCL